MIQKDLHNSLAYYYALPIMQKKEKEKRKKIYIYKYNIILLFDLSMLNTIQNAQRASSNRFVRGYRGCTH